MIFSSYAHFELIDGTLSSITINTLITMAHRRIISKALPSGLFTPNITLKMRLRYLFIVGWSGPKLERLSSANRLVQESFKQGIVQTAARAVEPSCNSESTVLQASWSNCSSDVSEMRLEFLSRCFSTRYLISSRSISSQVLVTKPLLLFIQFLNCAIHKLYESLPTALPL